MLILFVVPRFIGFVGVVPVNPLAVLAAGAIDFAVVMADAHVAAAKAVYYSGASASERDECKVRILDTAPTNVRPVKFFAGKKSLCGLRLSGIIIKNL